MIGDINSCSAEYSDWGNSNSDTDSILGWSDSLLDWEDVSLFDDSDWEDEAPSCDSESEDDLPLMNTFPKVTAPRSSLSFVNTRSSTPICSPMYPLFLVPCPMFLPISQPPTFSNSPISPFYPKYNGNRVLGPLIDACAGRPIRQMTPVENELDQLLHSFKTNNFMEQWWALQQN
ncbi:hypothetical protein PSACC_02011 [Paramicrosporidium saccamoebae]|uniref:Uncharacterized protein n=1 Tax=Paramicrosporidium saccamoebae TaxID=1246581 RepID=A0A2H9TKK4_9FUNG|nr:hypothetical protein PSACC_02011 [Paramicrosporidium saccamoebae]